MSHATVEREHEVLVDLVALVAVAHPADRLVLAQTLRADALYETVDLPPARSLVWLARRLEQTVGAAGTVRRGPGGSRNSAMIRPAVPVPSDAVA